MVKTVDTKIEKYIRIIEKYNNNPTLNIALDTINIGKQAIIFVNSKRSAEKTAEDIANKNKRNSVELINLSDRVLKVLSRPTKQCRRLAKCVKFGTAFHHAGLATKQRELIEDNFRKGVIKIISSTPTLAMGLDLPAYRTIIRDLKRFTKRGMQYIPVLEYKQMAGRAGRPSYDNEGQSIMVSSSQAQYDELEEKFLYGESESIYSKLAVEPVLRTYLLSLIAGNFVRTKEQIMDFFSKTFWAHQYQDMAKLDYIIENMLTLLVDWEFLISSKPPLGDFANANEINNDKYRATKLGRRVAELYLDPMTANDIICSLRKAKQIEVEPFSFLQMVSYTTELRPLLRVKMKEYDYVVDKFQQYDGCIITNEPTAFDYEYDEFLNSVKTTLFFIDWIDENDEEFLLEKYDIRPGEIRMKLEVADWLMYSTIEFAKLLEFRDLVKEVTKIRFRMKYGVKEELLVLLKLKKIGRVRARSMFRNGIKDIKGIKKTDVAKLGTIIKSRKIAEDVKEQLGQKVEKVKRGKRKGQKSINSWK
jgi:helicase